MAQYLVCQIELRNSKKILVSFLNTAFAPQNMSQLKLTNKAAWLLEKGAKLQVMDAEVVAPGPGEVLIRTHAWAINPIDWKMYAFGFAVKSYPVILGCDIAGEVAAIGTGVSNVKVKFSVLKDFRIPDLISF